MKVYNTIFIWLFSALVLGITIGYHLDIPITLLFILLGFLLITFTIAFFKTNRNIQQNSTFGLLAYLIFIGLGAIHIELHHSPNHSNHYKNKLTTSANYVVLKIKSELRPTTTYHQYIAQITQVNHHKTDGLVLLKINKKQQLTADEIISCSTQFQDINPPLNPYQFNYKAYLARKQIFHQIRLTHTNYTIENGRPSIFGFSHSIRNKIIKSLEQHKPSLVNKTIMKALLLGQRQTLDKSTINHFVNSGTIHLLAISGLHIGIIIYIIQFLFKPLHRIKYGKVFALSGTLFFLWSYVLLVGHTPSVVRAASMFSLFMIAQQLKRKTNSYNTLFVSAFILLLYNPFYLFDIGFQLSYTAVLAILGIYPALNSLWAPKWTVLRKFWQLNCVTLSAQLGLLPLSLYYFHQFPGLFLIANILIVPFLGIILGLGMLLIVCSLITHIPSMLFSLFDTCITYLFQVVQYLGTKQAYIFTNIPFSNTQLLLGFCLIFTITSFLKHYTIKNLRLSLVLIISIQLSTLIDLKRHATEQLIIFHDYKSPLIGIHNKHELLVYSNKPYSDCKKTVDAYITQEHIKQVIHKKQPLIINFHKNRLLIIDHTGIYAAGYAPTHILLTSSPNINLDRLLTNNNIKMVIADNTNYPTDINRWQRSCSAQKIPFHHLGEKGAVVIRE